MLSYVLSVIIGVVIIITVFILGMFFGYVTMKKVVDGLIEQYGDDFISKWNAKGSRLARPPS